MAGLNLCGLGVAGVWPQQALASHQTGNHAIYDSLQQAPTTAQSIV